MNQTIIYDTGYKYNIICKSINSIDTNASKCNELA